jgi:hypothetical protein
MPKYYTEDEDSLILATWHDGYHGYLSAGGDRPYSSFQKRKQHIAHLSRSEPLPLPTAEGAAPTQALKSLGDFSWREATTLIQKVQDLKNVASSTQQVTTIEVETDRPLAVMTLADTHIGAWSTDYDLFMRITDEILAVPDLRLVLLGDLAHMAIKMRSVEEVSDNLLPPDLQLRYLESWLEELQERILFCVWGNHEVEREEAQSGGSRFADLYKRRAVYFGGIGHADVRVGNHLYRIAASHKFRGTSQVNPVYGPQNYLLREGLDRDIAMAGDSHVPGLLAFNHGGAKKLAMNCGSVQTMSGYARRYFSLKTSPVMPLVTLDPETRCFAGYWSLEEYLRR